MLSLGQLYTDNTNDDTKDTNDDADDNDTNDTRRTNHDCLGSLACMPNEPKTTKIMATVFIRMEAPGTKNKSSGVPVF